MKVIYDFGANTGQDIPYYLLKSDLVVAVEANPDLCSALEEEFSGSVSQGRLVIINKALVSLKQGESCLPTSVELHVPKPGCKAGLGDAHSTIIEPANLQDPFFADPDAYSKVSVPAVRPSDIVSNYGSPYYIKIDVEHYDQYILQDLFDAGIFPDYISSEAHSSEVFAKLVGCGRYKMFKLIIGGTVGQDFASCVVRLYPQRLHKALGDSYNVSSKQLENLVVTTSFRFETGMSGPFGDDIPGKWLSADELFDCFAMHGRGWIDIHAKSSLAVEE